MDYVEAPPAVSSSGTTLTYRYAEQPAVKVFIPQASENERYASLFWQGMGDLKSLARFFESIGPLALSTVEVPSAGRDGTPAIGSAPPLKSSDPRLYWRINGGNTSFDIWADLQVREGGLTPEVGVASKPSVLASDPMRSACIDLILDTARWRPQKNEVQALVEAVGRRIAGFDAPPTFGFGAF